MAGTGLIEREHHFGLQQYRRIRRFGGIDETTSQGREVSTSIDGILSLLAPGFLRETRKNQARRSAQEVRLAAVKATSAAKPHGTRARYVGGRCRCNPCREANRLYQAQRVKAKIFGDWNGLVSAERARQYLTELSANGIGRHSVQAACDVSDGILFAIITGTKKQIRARTERRILAVDEGARGGKSLISAAATWKLLRELLKDGYSKVQLAEWLGHQHALQINRRRVTADTAANVERMYRLIQAGKLKRTR
jgi:hypothetical protein